MGIFHFFSVPGSISWFSIYLSLSVCVCITGIRCSGFVKWNDLNTKWVEPFNMKKQCDQQEWTDNKKRQWKKNKLSHQTISAVWHGEVDNKCCRHVKKTERMRKSIEVQKLFLRMLRKIVIRMTVFGVWFLRGKRQRQQQQKRKSTKIICCFGGNLCSKH